MRKAEQIRGCTLGGAIGDCFGGPYEGQKSPVTIDNQRPWSLSDDTQLTLATCEAIVTRGQVDPATLAATFAKWFKARRVTGIGASTYKALSELCLGGHWALVGRKGEMAAGNGAAMRSAPLAFCLDPTAAKDRVVIRDVCRITHHNEEAYVGALAVVLAVRAAWEGKWTTGKPLLPFVIAHLPESGVRERLAVMTELGEHVSLSEVAARFGCSGYVVESVPLVLWGVQQAGPLGFPTLLEELIAVGGDTDTNASIAGQILGTVLGYAALPKQLLDRLPDLEMIEQIVQAFSQTVLKEAV